MKHEKHQISFIGAPCLIHTQMAGSLMSDMTMEIMWIWSMTWGFVKKK